MGAVALLIARIEDLVVEIDDFFREIEVFFRAEDRVALRALVALELAASELALGGEHLIARAEIPVVTDDAPQFRNGQNAFIGLVEGLPKDREANFSVRSSLAFQALETFFDGHDGLRAVGAPSL